MHTVLLCFVLFRSYYLVSSSDLFTYILGVASEAMSNLMVLVK